MYSVPFAPTATTSDRSGCGAICVIPFVSAPPCKIRTNAPEFVSHTCNSWLDPALAPTT